jgi:hypothetical protein
MSRNAFRSTLAASAALGAVLAGLAIAPSAGASGAGSRADWVTSVTATGLIKLVSPTGEQVTLTSRGAGYEIADVSTDGNRIVLLNTKTNTIAYYDAATKKRSTFSVAGFDGLGREEVRLTRPTGAEVLVNAPRRGMGATPGDLGLDLLRYDLSGRVTLALTDVGHALPSVDGKTLVTVSGRQVQIRSNASGSVARTVPAPADACMPSRWWDSGSVQLTCSPGSGLPTYRVGLASGSATLVSNSVDIWTVVKSPLGTGGFGGQGQCENTSNFGLLKSPSRISNFALNVPAGYLAEGKAFVGGYGYYNVLKKSCGLGGSAGVYSYDLLTKQSRKIGNFTNDAVVIDPLR